MGRGVKTDLLLYFGPAKEIVLSTWEQIFLEIIYSECAIPTNKQKPQSLSKQTEPLQMTQKCLYIIESYKWLYSVRCERETLMTG